MQKDHKLAKGSFMGDIASFLSRNLLSLRKARNLTQAALAKKADVPRSTLTHLESGEGNPSLKTLHAVAVALDVSLEELLARPRARCEFVAACNIPVKLKAGGLVQVFKLLPDPIPGMEIDRMEMNPGARFVGTPHLARTKEYLTCIEGDIQMAVDGETFHLRAGDVLAFPGDLPHSYKNAGHNQAIAISVVILAGDDILRA